ncbi:MAG: RsmB/NOP family class I SAM-dependent RNA methyltransferase [Planctomycetota bacterium]
MPRKSRPTRRPPLPPRWLIGACGATYRACLDAPGAPDKVIARAFREDGRLAGEARGFLADVVQGMLRARGFVEAAMRHVSRGRDEDAVLVFLRARRGLTVGPRAAGLGGAIAAGERETGGIDAFVPEWMKRMLPGGHELLRSFATEPPVTLRANTLKISPRELAEWLWQEGIAAQPASFSPLGMTLEDRANVFRTEAFRQGMFEMQDEGSQLVAFLCAPGSADVVVDGCAGAGGKTLALAAMMENRGTLHAFDTAAFRLDELRERAARAGAQNVRVQLLESDPGLLKRLHGKADVVLIDAPCSGTGVLRRNPDIAWKLREEDIPRLVEEQARLLAAYAPLVKPGGRLVYAVCSLLPVEGEKQIARFLREHADFRRADAAAILRRAGVKPDGLLTRGDLSIDPVRHGTDGFYAAALSR